VYQRITQIAPGVLLPGKSLLTLAFNDAADARASLFAMSEVAPDKGAMRAIVRQVRLSQALQMHP
jgi:hypothetical protein